VTVQPGAASHTRRRARVRSASRSAARRTLMYSDNFVCSVMYYTGGQWSIWKSAIHRGPRSVNLHAKMLARLTRLGISCDATPSQLRSARDHFAQHRYLRMSGFIEPGLLRVVQRYLAATAFEEREYAAIGRDLSLSKDHPLANVFFVLMNDPKLFRLIRRVTGCGPIGSFTGRFYKIVPRQGGAFTWHDDVGSDRQLAISINLSDAAYQGGILQIRDLSCGIRETLPNPGFGDAIIFPIAEHLEHRVTPVKGKFPKTAFSGWFCSRPNYASVHRDFVGRAESANATRAVRKHNHLALPSPRDVVKIPSAVVSRTVNGETFVANIGTAMCYGLRDTGCRIWELLAEGHSMRSISVTIAREYGAPRREVERDVLALAYRLAQRDLIKVVRAPTRDGDRAIVAADGG